MVFRSSKRTENTSDSDTGVTTNRVVDRTATESSSETGGWSRKSTLEETEAHFGMKVPDKNTMFRLQRLEAMNTTERPPEVPTNIER